MVSGHGFAVGEGRGGGSGVFTGYWVRGSDVYGGERGGSAEKLGGGGGKGEKGTRKIIN